MDPESNVTATRHTAMIDVAAVGLQTVPDGLVRAPEHGGPRRDACHRLLENLRDAGTPTVERRYDAGDLICGEEEYGSALHVVLEGAAKLSVVQLEAREAILRLAGPLEPIGIPVSGWKPTHPTRAEVFTGCDVVKVPKVFVERAVREHPGVALDLTTLLALEVAHRQELFGCLLPRTTEARLARLLPILVRQFGTARGRCWTIELRLTHYDLAEMVASTRESVTAAVNSLRRRGVLEKDAGIISILKPDALAQVASTWVWPGPS